jgi:hypothetical protein
MKIGLMMVTTTIATDRKDILQGWLMTVKLRTRLRRKKLRKDKYRQGENSLLVSDPLKTK